MDTGNKPGPEHPSTYFVEDRGDKSERERVTIQDQMITRMMGGVLPEQDVSTPFHRILDVGCGTGSWLIEAAQEYPTLATLVGVDVSRSIVESAREYARKAGVDDRVEFHVMDALRMIEFPHGYFDLVNQRLGLSYLRTWDWSNILREYQRISRYNGIIRITEGDVFGETNSEALTQLFTMARSAFFASGHMFWPERDGVTGKLAELMHQAGILTVQTRSVLLDYSATSPYLPAFRDDMWLTFHGTIVPFIRKWYRLPTNYDEILHQAMEDMQQPEFTAQWEMVTAWGINGQMDERVLGADQR